MALRSEGLTPLQAAAMVERFTYQPGWTFKASLGEGHRVTEGVAVSVAWQVPDIHRGYGTTRLCAIFTLDRWELHTDALLWQLWQAIERLEGHERLEQLRYDGQPVWDAHAGGEFRSTPSGTPQVGLPGA